MHLALGRRYHCALAVKSSFASHIAFGIRSALIMRLLSHRRTVATMLPVDTICKPVLLMTGSMHLLQHAAMMTIRPPTSCVLCRSGNS